MRSYVTIQFAARQTSTYAHAITYRSESMCNGTSVAICHVEKVGASVNIQGSLATWRHRLVLVEQLIMGYTACTQQVTQIVSCEVTWLVNVDERAVREYSVWFLDRVNVHGHILNLYTRVLFFSSSHDANLFMTARVCISDKNEQSPYFIGCFVYKST